MVERIAEVLLSPLGVLRLGSGDTTDPLISPALDPIADLLVGVPFIFFVLGLREFFRSPLGPRSRPTNAWGLDRLACSCSPVWPATRRTGNGSEGKDRNHGTG